MKIFIDPRSSINYSSFYIQGLYDFFGKHKVSFSSKYFKDLQEIDMLLAFVFINDKEIKRIIIDYRDQTDIIEDAYQWSNMYAKINVNKSTFLHAHPNKILNIPPSFAIKIWNPLELIFHLGNNFFKAKIMKHIHDKNIHLRPKIWVRNYLTLFKRQKLSDYNDFYENENEKEKENYVFFVSTHWEGCDDTNLYRRSYVLFCLQNKSIHFSGGFFIGRNTRIPENIPSDLLFDKFISNSIYLKNMKKSIFVFNTPAVHHCHGWKLGEFLCMGKAIISSPLLNDLPVPLRHNENIFIIENEADIDSAIDELLNNKDLRHKLEKNARLYYEKYASPTKVIERIIHACG
ncbi:MAG: hypothetical protein LBT25_04025 [Candidatus Symbiothrix sp.]|jgi:hypothetical protein|nr:hypothetical protein [Candidatus Symbiothrix sp.]